MKMQALSIPTIFTSNDKPFAGLALPHIASRVFDTPLMITVEKAEQIMEFLLPRLEGRVPIESDLFKLSETNEYKTVLPNLTFAEVAARNGVEVIRAKQSGPVRVARGDSNKDLGFDILPTTNGNIGVVPVSGTLVQKGAYLRESSGMTSYQGIKTTINNALTDERVSSILIYINSPGGDAFGLFDFAASLRLLAQNESQPKPIFAFTDGVMASAAYAIGSAAARVYAEDISTVGSIGVLQIHRDKSAQNAVQGIKVTYITSGIQKAEGNPDEPLAAEAHARIQARVNKIADKFFSIVSTARAGSDAKVQLSTADIAALQAGVFLGGEAYERKLTDGVRTLRQVVDEMSAEMSARKKGKRTRAAASALAAAPSSADAPSQDQTKQQSSQQASQQSSQPNGGHTIMSQATAQAAAAAAPAVVSLFDGDGNPVSMESVLAGIPQFAQAMTTISNLTTKLEESETARTEQTARVESLLTLQEQKDMMSFVQTRLRGLPVQPAHMASMLLRLKAADSKLYGEFLLTFATIARVFSKDSKITAERGHALVADGRIVHVGEGGVGGRQHVDPKTQVEEFHSENGTVVVELTPQIKEYNAAVSKIATDRGVDEITAMEIVSAEQPELLHAAQASMGSTATRAPAAPDGPGGDVYDPDDVDGGETAADLGLDPNDPAYTAISVTAAEIDDPEMDGALIGAMSGPDVDLLRAAQAAGQK